MCGSLGFFYATRICPKAAPPMGDFEPGFEITPTGVSFIARVDGHLVGCWIDASALTEKEGIRSADLVTLRKLFTKHEALIRDRITQKIGKGAAEPDRTFSLHSG